jgi:RimJ/RimL family protein N-acetyltransferase
VENVGSQRVLEKGGFEREGRLRGYFKLRGRRMDNYLYSLLREEFLARQAGRR